MANTLHPSLHRILLICVIFSLLFVSGCSAPQTGLESPAATPADALTSPTGGSEELADTSLDNVNVDELEVRFLAEDYQPASYASEPLGTIAFKEAAAAAVEREITPEDDPVELQVVDGAGLNWTLKIPAGAFDRQVTVRMVPLTDLDGSGIHEPAGVVTGGVQLEPDGLTFHQPVQLTVSGAELEGPTLILSGNREGAEVDYTLQDTEASDPTARVLHFSTYFAIPLPEPEIAEINKRATKEYNKLAEVAKKLRKAPLDVPTPPSIPLDCPDEETAKVLDQFVKNALNPETDLALKMLAQWKIITMTSDHEVEAIPDLVIGMALRLTRKATAMMKQYYGTEDKLVAVSYFAIDAARKLALLGGDQEMIQRIIDGLADWNLGLIDKMVNDIAKNHNYKRIPTAMRIAYNASVLGKGGITTEFLAKLREVLRFEARVKFTMEDPFIKANNITEAVVPLQFEPAHGWVYKCYGEGTGKPLKAMVDEEGWTIKANKYPVKVWITEFDPCSGTVKFAIDRFGSDQDTATFKNMTNSWNVSQLAAESLFEEETINGVFTFTLPVQNGNVNMVDTRIDRNRDDGIVNGILEVQIIHK